MDINDQLAKQLGFPKRHYRIVERERRWLCAAVLQDLVSSVERISDLYVSSSRLRLREARSTDGGQAMLRLSRKADADETTRLISSVYLSEDDFAVLNTSLCGARLSKTRYRLRAPPGIALCIDEFEGVLTGLRIVEAEFENDETLEGFEKPVFAGREITSDARYTGFALATEGPPA